MSLWRSLELVRVGHKHLLSQLGVLFWAPGSYWWCSILWWLCSPHGRVTSNRGHPGRQLAIDWLIVGWLSCVLLLWLAVVWSVARRGRLLGGKLPMLVAMKVIATGVQMTVNLLVFCVRTGRQTKLLSHTQTLQLVHTQHGCQLLDSQPLKLVLE